jgi:magnesium chelatase subunit I
MTAVTTLGELKRTGYRTLSVRDELRENLLRKLRNKEKIFPGITGFDDTVLPQVINAVLAKQSFILLGTRGQAKTRLLRSLINLLDQKVPVLRDAEIPEDPYNPISKLGREIIQREGDNAAIRYLEPDERYVEKLATPDVTIADIIGDLDPIKAAKEGHLLSNELVIQFGLLPRANRGIFAINELPDLAGKIQVGLFNILEEGDVQIKGFPVRLPLDVMMVFSANPEDYTARGKIITPLKDRIGAEIRTHYPQSLQEGVAITAQESWADRTATKVVVPQLVREVVEAIAFIARADRRIDKRSGVSQRLPIAVLELATSNAERRTAMNGDDASTVRIADIYSSLPAITGKIELEYEGEQYGAERIAQELIRKACAFVYAERFKNPEVRPVLDYFKNKRSLELSDNFTDSALLQAFSKVGNLVEASKRGRMEEETVSQQIVACELVLEGLHANRKLARAESRSGRSFSVGSEEQKRSRVVVDESDFDNLN